MKNFLLKEKSSLIKIAIFNYSLIKLINYIYLSYLKGIIFLA
jgi:hypothetical protein